MRPERFLILMAHAIWRRPHGGSSPRSRSRLSKKALSEICQRILLESRRDWLPQHLTNGPMRSLAPLTPSRLALAIAAQHQTWHHTPANLARNHRHAATICVRSSARSRQRRRPRLSDRHGEPHRGCGTDANGRASAHSFTYGNGTGRGNPSPHCRPRQRIRPQGDNPSQATGTGPRGTIRAWQSTCPTTTMRTLWLLPKLARLPISVPFTTRM